MLIFRTIGLLVLGLWLLVGLGLTVVSRSAADGGATASQVAPSGADTSRSVAEQWELERREAEAKARYERGY